MLQRNAMGDPNGITYLVAVIADAVYEVGSIATALDAVIAIRLPLVPHPQQSPYSALA